MNMFGVLGWMLFGLIVGAVAKLLTPGRDPRGFLTTMVLGLAGSLVGGWVGRVLGWSGRQDGANLVMSVIGAVIVLALFHGFFARRVVWRSRLSHRL